MILGTGFIDVDINNWYEKQEKIFLAVIVSSLSF